MTTRSSALLLCLASTLTMSLACEARRGSNSPAAPSPATPSTPSTSSTAELTGHWTSASATPSSRPSATTSAVAKLSSCDNFDLRVTSQTGNVATGTFSVVCLGAYSITGTATGTITSRTSAHIELAGSTTVSGVGACPVNVVSDATLEGDIIRLPFTADTCLGRFTGLETLRKSDIFPSPEPPPAPAPPPAPEPPPSTTPPATSADAIDLRAARIVLGPSSVAAWPQTSTVIGVRSGGGQLCVNHTKLGAWPLVRFFDTTAYVEASQWVFANIGGQWVGGAGEWVRPGQECKAVDAQSIGRDAFYGDNMEPLRSWVPRPGEQFAVMVTTPARAWPNMTSTNERSNVVFVRWAD
ncbi:MAG: hypothetical protein ABS36_15420 [Acidobacteria bacterium SCN 69-37]|nr:MAG: hypothetical protein ABS36_15420 [Acidobacteria bacterium SCN 69-37]